MTKRVEDIKRVLLARNEHRKRLEEKLNLLSERRVEAGAELSRLLTQIFGDESQAESDVARNRIAVQKEAVLDNLSIEQKLITRADHLTRWDVLNGVSYMTSHQLERRQTKGMGEAERRLSYVLFDQGRDIVQTAFAALMS